MYRASQSARKHRIGKAGVLMTVPVASRRLTGLKQGNPAFCQILPVAGYGGILDCDPASVSALAAPELGGGEADQGGATPTASWAW